MNDRDKAAEARWAEIHHELDQEGAASLRQALSSDTTTLATLREAQALDRNLHALMPNLELTPQALEDEILAAFDADASTTAAPTPLAMPAPFSIWPLLASRRFQYWNGVLAAAAAITLLVSGLQFYAAGPVTWNQPEFAALRLRGTAPAYTRADAALCLSALKDGLAAANGRHGIRERLFGSSAARWELHFRFEERASESMAVIVAAGKPGATPELRWERRCANTAEFLSNVDALSREIAQALHAD